MRCLALALGLIGLAGEALAADLPNFPPIMREPLAYVPAFPTYFPWQGFYAGGQLSDGVVNANFTSTTQPLIAQALRNSVFEEEFHPSQITVLGPTDAGSAGFGGFVGYNAQFENTIIGVELNYTRTNFNAISPDNPIGRITPVLSSGKADDFVLFGSGSMHITDIGVLRARAGYVVDTFVPYITFGLAAGRADLAVSVSCNPCQEGVPNNSPPPVLTNPVDISFTQSEGKNQAYLFGWAAGGGLDVALTRNLFGRAEYEYIQFSPVFQITSHIHMGRVGLGLKF